MVAAVVVVTCTGLGFLGGWWWPLDLVANLRTQQALVLAVIAVALLLAGHRRTAAVAVIGASLNGALLVPFVVTSSPTPPPDAPTLEIFFLNVKRDAAQPAAVAAHVREHEPDLVVLVAATPDWVRTLGSAVPGMVPVAGPHLTPGLEVVVLSQHANVDARVHQPQTADRSAVVEIGVMLDDTRVHVLATHPVSPMTPQRARRRDAHLAFVGALAGGRPGPVAVVGDLNATPWSSAFRGLLEDGDLVDSQRAAGLQPSWPTAAGRFGLPIDHVLHSPGLATVERRLGPSFGSDHRSLTARLALLRDVAAG